MEAVNTLIPQEYKKKPVSITAIQLTERNLESVFNFLGEHANYPECKKGGIDPATGKFMIKSLEGDMVADENDFIICGLKGEFYPCKPDIFYMSYDHISLYL